MKDITVENLMVPSNAYPTISGNAALIEAIDALEEALRRDNGTMVSNPVLLVRDETDNIVGKISQLDILRAIESDSGRDNELNALAKYGFSQKTLTMMIAEHKLRESTSNRIDQKATALKVREFMYTVTEGEFIDKESPLSEAIHIFVAGHYHSLLVVSKKKILGILRLVDVFNVIYNSTRN